MLACAAPAFAQSSQAAATVQFDQGRALMKQKKYKEACAAFEKSQKLDAQNGTLFNLAECDAHVGKLATAWLAYRDLGQRDTNAGRKKEANRRAKELEKRLPKLVLQLASPPAGLAVTINANDATSLVGIENPVDLGDYEIRATAPGYEAFETTASVSVEGKTVKVTLELEKAGREPAAKKVVKKRVEPEPEPEPDRDPGVVTPPHRKRDRVDQPTEAPVSHRRRNGALVAVAGGTVVAVGAVFGVRALGRWNDAQELCADKTCPTQADKDRGDALVDEARSNATLSTALVLGGAAIATVGIYFVATGKHQTPTTALRVTPTAGGAAVVLGGRF